jgi:cytochrome c oxidase subunit 2
MLESSSPFADYVDTTFLTIVGISALVLIGLLITVVWFLIRYNRRRNPNPTQIAGNIPLELTWTLIPLVLFMGMFYLGWKGYLMEEAIPENAVPIQVTAQMWKWTFEYPNGMKADTLYVPVNTPIKVVLHSLDVNHAFFVPAFRLKKDVIPNRTNVAWFQTSRIASYDIACAEYCGLNHSMMYNKVVSMDTSAFNRWYKEQSTLQAKLVMPFAVSTTEQNS